MSREETRLAEATAKLLQISCQSISRSRCCNSRLRVFGQRS